MFKNIIGFFKKNKSNKQLEKMETRHGKPCDQCGNTEYYMISFGYGMRMHKMQKKV